MFSPEPDTQSPGTLHYTVVSFVLFGAVVFMQIASGAYDSEFGSYPDEAAHVVTGLMVHDYLTNFPWPPPLQFAETYYLHYPKVALGHWPPVFYIIQAMWMSIFGATRVSLLLLMASFCTTLAVMLYHMVCRVSSPVYATVAVLGLLLLPCIQQSTTAVMADLLLANFVFGATLAFGRYLEGTRPYRDAVVFALLASLAILTKGNGFLLVLVPGWSLLLMWRFTYLRYPSFWLLVGLVAFLCLPFYWFASSMTDNLIRYNIIRHPMSGAKSAAFTSLFSSQIVHLLGISLTILGVVGVVRRIIVPLWRREEIPLLWVAFASLVVSTWVFHSIFPIQPDERYLLPIVPVALLFAVEALQYVCQQLEKRVSLSLHLVAAVVGVVLLLGTYLEFGFSRKDWHGYGEVASFVTQKPEWTNSIILVSSDSTGEGMLIAEVALGDQRPHRYVLRASKMLAKDTWGGLRYRKLFDSPTAVMDFLTSVPVGILVLDTSVTHGQVQEHHQQLQSMVHLFSDKWHLVGQYDLTRKGRFYPQAIQVYELEGHQRLPPGKIEIDMKAVLGANIEKGNLR